MKNISQIWFFHCKHDLFIMKFSSGNTPNILYVGKNHIAKVAGQVRSSKATLQGLRAGTKAYIPMLTFQSLTINYNFLFLVKKLFFF